MTLFCHCGAVVPKRRAVDIGGFCSPYCAKQGDPFLYKLTPTGWVRFRRAQGIEAGTDETLQAAQPEGQELGGVAMRPDTVTPTSQDTNQ